jgi:Domain of unknown function (DUF6398)
MTNLEHRTVKTVKANFTQPEPALGFAAIRRAVRLETGTGARARDLANRVGGLDELESLNADPLEDEPFDWTAIPDAGCGFVAEVVDLIANACGQFLDTEYRTASQRLLARVMSHDPRAVLRSTRPDRIAAGVVHAVLQGNGQLERRSGRWKASDVGRWFGTSSASEIAQRLTHTANFELAFEADSYYLGYRRTIDLPSPRLLHSRTRTLVVEQRESLIKSIEDEERRRNGRRPLINLGDGRIQVRSCPADVAIVSQGVGPGRQVSILLGLAAIEPDPDLDLFALSIPEALRLRHLLDHALDGPAPRFGHGEPSAAYASGFGLIHESSLDRFTATAWDG